MQITKKLETVKVFYVNRLFQDVIREWLKIHSLKIAESTLYNYEKTANHLITFFHDYDVMEITSDILQNFVIGRVNAGCAQNTIINYCKILHMSLDYAEQRNYINSSPYRGITLPRKDAAEITPFHYKEIEKLLTIPMDEWIRDSIIISYKTGMRKGEIFALKKGDINFEKGFLMVRRTQSLTKNGITLKHPKTKSSRRRIDLDNATLTTLNRRAKDSVSEFIFTWPDGRMIVPWNICSLIKKKCALAGISQHKFHDLRHGHATYLLISNVHPKIVQERLGHASINITLDTYSHLIPGLQKTAVNAISALDF